MQRFNSYENLPENCQNAIVAVGNFDGVHRGHQAVFQQVCSLAKAENKPSAVLTFEPHPVSVLHQNKKPFRLSPPPIKAKLIEACGIEILWEIPFTRELAALSPEEFIGNVLIKGVRASVVVVGEDFVFGKNRAGTIETLKKLANQESVQIKTIAEITDHSARYSSTRARHAIEQGNIDEARAILGHPFWIEGCVEEGDKRGRALGFPTANITLGDYIRPRYGVYAVKVRYENQCKNGVANIGVRPTFQGLQERFEVHIFAASENLYGKELEVEFIEFIRSERAFASEAELREQIKSDSLKAQQLLNARETMAEKGK